MSYRRTQGNLTTLTIDGKLIELYEQANEIQEDKEKLARVNDKQDDKEWVAKLDETQEDKEQAWPSVEDRKRIFESLAQRKESGRSMTDLTRIDKIQEDKKQGDTEWPSNNYHLEAPKQKGQERLSVNRLPEETWQKGSSINYINHFQKERSKANETQEDKEKFAVRVNYKQDDKEWSAKFDETQEEKEQAGPSVKDLKRSFEMWVQKKQTDRFRKEKSRSMIDLRSSINYINHFQKERSKANETQEDKEKFARVNYKEDDKEWSAAKFDKTQEEKEQAGPSVKDLKRSFEMWVQKKETDRFRKGKSRSMPDLTRIDEIQEDKKQGGTEWPSNNYLLEAPKQKGQERLSENRLPESSWQKAAKFNETQEEKEQAGPCVKDLKRSFEMPVQKKETDQFRKEKTRIDEIQEDKKQGGVAPVFSSPKSNTLMYSGTERPSNNCLLEAPKQKSQERLSEYLLPEAPWQKDQFLIKRSSLTMPQENLEWAEQSLRERGQSMKDISARYEETEEDKKQCENKDQEKETLRKDLEKKDQEKETLRKDLEKKDQEKETLRKDLEKKDQEKEMLRKDLEKKDQEKETLRKDLEKIDQEKEMLWKDLETLRKDLETLRKDLEKKDQEQETLRKDLEKKDQEKEMLREDLEMLQKDLEKKKQEKETLQNDLEKREQEKEKLQKEMEKRKAQFKLVWKSAPLYPDWRKEAFDIVNMTLDELTAHPNLLISENGTQVTWQEKCQDVTDSITRFDSLHAVLGQLTVTRGRIFWEVEVDSACSWDLGVCRDNVTRKGRVTISPNNGFWAIRMYDGEYWAITSPETQLFLNKKPCIVGIFLDFEDRDISFYDMNDNSLIYSFPKASFYGTLRPFLRLWDHMSGTLRLFRREATLML